MKKDGSAKANRGKYMVGTWVEKGNIATITWKTGWKTQIIKDEKGYKKFAFKKGQSLDSKPANTSEAKKLR